MSVRKVRIFHPFQKVWTPRSPDSNYDSLGIVAQPPIVNAFVTINNVQTVPSDELGNGIGLGPSNYEALQVSGGGAESSGAGIKLQSATYTPA